MALRGESIGVTTSRRKTAGASRWRRGAYRGGNSVGAIGGCAK
jgi:hypothetical protein